MTRIVAALFPDRTAAQRALENLSTAGFEPQFDEDGYVGDKRGYVVVAGVQDREADLRDLLMHAGAISLQGHGADRPGLAGGPATNREEPIPVRDGERLGPRESPAAARSGDGTRDGKDGDDQKAPPTIHQAPTQVEAVDGVRRDMGGSPH